MAKQRGGMAIDVNFILGLVVVVLAILAITGYFSKNSLSGRERYVNACPIPQNLTASDGTNTVKGTGKGGLNVQWIGTVYADSNPNCDNMFGSMAVYSDILPSGKVWVSNMSPIPGEPNKVAWPIFADLTSITGPTTLTGTLSFGYSGSPNRSNTLDISVDVTG